MRTPVVLTLVFLALAALLAGAAQTATTANLLRDPGAEQGGYGDWETANGFVIEQYGADNRPSKAVGDSISGGKNVFAGGSDADNSSATQFVDVSSQAASIDGGGVNAQLGGYLGGVDDEDDYSVVTADFLPAAGDEVRGTSLKIGPVTAADRNNQTALLPRSTSGPVPAGTRRIRVTIYATRAFGVYTDGYADNLSLTLNGSAVAPTVTPAATVTATVTATPAPAKPTTVTVKRKGKKVSGKVKASAPCKSGRKVVLKKGKKTIASAKSKGSGKFTLKSKKAKKGKLKVTVKKRTVTSGGVKVTCKSTAKKV